MIRTSLNFRLWLTIAIAVLPVLLFVFFDFHERREQAVAETRAEIALRLADANREAQAAHRAVALVLRIMARSNDLQALDSAQCSGIAGRLLKSLDGFANIGAALPDGEIFCSGRPMSAPVTVIDRAWFRTSLDSDEISPGEFVIGRVSGTPSMAFGYPLRAADGTLRAVIFATITVAWFDRLIEGFRLPEGWEASVISNSGLVLAHQPERAPEGWRAHKVPATTLARMAAVVRDEGGIAELAGIDGVQRLYGIGVPDFAPGSGFFAIGAPLERSLEAAGQRLLMYLALVAAIALASALIARLYIYRLIEVWATRVRGAIAEIAAGRRDARIGQATGVAELDALSEGIDQMALEIGKREGELQRLSMVIEQSPESIVITDTAGCILYVNEAFQRITGYARDEVLGRNPRILNGGLTPRATYEQMWATLLAGEVWRGEFHNVRKDGSAYLELATIAPIKDAGGTVTHYVAVKEDITQRKQSEALLHRLAYFDALTGLPNRALLHDRIAQAIRSGVRRESFGMLMLVDIDRFRQLNDTLGHAAGDRLLCEVAARLRASVREEDTVARHGDDDFAVLVERIGETEADALSHAEHVARKLQRALQQPYVLGGTEGDRHFATLSFGISLFHDGVSSLESLLKQAEVALYRAKQDGRDIVRFFNPEMQAVVDAHARLEARMHEALEANAFRLFFQPQVNRRGVVIGAEALLRWPLDGGAMVSPAEFIPLAEDTGHIVRLGLWVLRSACAQLARWQMNEGTRHLKIAVNVSARQFHQPDFVASVKDSVRAAAIDPCRLELELTESAILSDVDETIRRMNELRALGIRFALDDFGTGYSSLSYLKRLPFDQLKIDQSFVRDMAEDESSEAIVLAILSLSHALGLEVVAEGVEMPEQRDFLRQHGCDSFQGYLFGKPLPMEAWGDFLEMI
ncbi:bifunctional diguanylate cyclase/phosphodiesterase [Thauera aminoaromatica]|uniref:PAS/PAC sensor-containing diguanylate cyclase/phosphodiesterase n=2 Tax=Thauera aminoaromatica TaxID=164330 RepID=N6Y0W2_THASP|nr:EAL domain-containing protein [Thauera aminoaromatica]ACK54094.1 diguanylate cyclase/phosphodiesterase with PAS/PAC sensor(s) [Thauera aminoaromatica]ENO85160.1 PAS/PAC sensor-containing diguanylate cyclase/phosphodiesterase [Thauera aminoaromatica S2]